MKLSKYLSECVLFSLMRMKRPGRLTRRTILLFPSLVIPKLHAVMLMHFITTLSLSVFLCFLNFYFSRSSLLHARQYCLCLRELQISPPPSHAGLQRQSLPLWADHIRQNLHHAWRPNQSRNLALHTPRTLPR